MSSGRLLRARQAAPRGRRVLILHTQAWAWRQPAYVASYGSSRGRSHTLFSPQLPVVARLISARRGWRSHSRSRLLGRQTAEYGMPTDCPDFAHAALCSDAVGAVWMLSASLTTSPRLRQLSLSNCVPTRQSARLTRSARWKASVLTFERACCSTVAARCQSGWQRVTKIWLKVAVAFNFLYLCPCFGTSRTHTQPAGPVVFLPCRALYIRDVF